MPTALIWGAIVTSGLVLAVTIIDQAGSRQLYGFTEAAYAPHGLTPDPGLVYAILYAVAITITLLWGFVFLLSRKRGWWAPVRSAVATFVTGVTAILLLTSTEYGEQVFSPVWGLLVLTPTVLGIIATILLVRDAPASKRTVS